MRQENNMNLAILPLWSCIEFSLNASRLSVAKPKPSLSQVKSRRVNKKSRWKQANFNRNYTRVTKWRLLLVLILISWEDDAKFPATLVSKIKIKQLPVWDFQASVILASAPVTSDTTNTGVTWKDTNKWVNSIISYNQCQNDLTYHDEESHLCVE